MLQWSVSGAVLVLMFCLLMFVGGFVLAKRIYRKKYKQEHLTTLNCVTFSPDAPKRLIVLTVATSENPELDRLITSILRVGDHSVEIIGIGCKWQGFGNKPLWLAEKIRKMRLKESDLVLFVDAYDVVCCRPLKQLVSIFEAFEKDIVFSAELGCHPDPSLAPKFPVSETSHRFPNAGGFVGYAKAILDMIDEMAPRPDEDDQLMVCTYVINHPDKCGIDYRSEIFLSLYGLDSDSIEKTDPRGAEGVLKYKATQTLPFFVHGNGPAKSLLNRVFPISN